MPQTESVVAGKVGLLATIKTQRARHSNAPVVLAVNPDPVIVTESPCTRLVGLDVDMEMIRAVRAPEYWYPYPTLLFFVPSSKKAPFTSRDSAPVQEGRQEIQNA